MQKVVRTYTLDWSAETKRLEEALSDGWKVLMVNRIGTGKNEQLEYILEKDDRKNEQMEILQS